MKSVHDLRQEELEELRERLFHQLEDQGATEEIFGEEIYSAEEIPMDYIIQHYEGTYFTEDDFWCNFKD